jgi:predicted transcriptional regulator
MSELGRDRESVDIVADILRIAEEGSGKTKIMYRANLSYTLLSKYLHLVGCCGLLNNNAKRYTLTNKGITFLKKYDSYIQRRKYIADSIMELNSERVILERVFNLNNK